MAKKTILKEKTAQELSKMLTELRGTLRGHRFASAGARPKDTSAHANTRKDIARVLTAMTAQKTLSKESAPAPVAATELTA